MSDPDRSTWFGDPWPSAGLRAEVCADDTYQVPTPVGVACTLCTEPIADGDRGTAMPHIGVGPDGEWLSTAGYVHIECLVRSTTGNHLHMRGLCHEVGSCNTMSNLSFREEALEVWTFMHGL